MTAIESIAAAERRSTVFGRASSPATSIHWWSAERSQPLTPLPYSIYSGLATIDQQLSGLAR